MRSGLHLLFNTPPRVSNPRHYFSVFDGVRSATADGRLARFELVLCKSVDTYVRVKRNQNQVGAASVLGWGRRRTLIVCVCVCVYA